MRRLWVVLVLAAAGCTVHTETVPGAAAPITATATPAPTPSYTTLKATGFGVTVDIPVPSDWTRTPTRTAGLTRTDADLADPPVKLRIDLAARSRGSARDGTLSNERTAGLTGYRRLDIAAVPDVGDDAVDWTFTFERDGTRQVVDRQIQEGTAVVAVYYSAPREVYQRYLPVWQNAVAKLKITSS